MQVKTIANFIIYFAIRTNSYTHYVNYLSILAD